MILQTTHRILRNNLFVRNYTRKAAVIGSTPDRSTPEYQENYVHMKNLVTELQNVVQRVVQGGGEKAKLRHTSKGPNA